MPSTATPANLKADGFINPAAFGVDVAGFDTYLQGVLNEAGEWATYRVGTVAYAAATGYALSKIVRAERAYAASILWRSRARFIDANATQALQEGAYLERREFLRQGDLAEEEAERAIAEAIRATGGDVTAQMGGVGASVGHVETGRYPIESTAALNG